MLRVNCFAFHKGKDHDRLFSLMKQGQLPFNRSEDAIAALHQYQLIAGDDNRCFRLWLLLEAYNCGQSGLSSQV